MSDTIGNMALTVNYASIQDALKKIIRQNDFLMQHFERNFRDVISSAPLDALISSKIPSHVIQNALESSLESTALLAQEEYERSSIDIFRTISEQLWNPMVATLLRTALPVVTAGIEKKKSSSSIVKPKKGARSPPSARPVTGITAEEVKTIRSRLTAVALTRPRLYENTPHVKCTIDNCAFCSHMFHTLNITKCEGHKRCSAVGWYPHIGKPLWSQLRTKHEAQVPCRLKPQPCKAHELPSLRAEETPSQGSPSTSAEMDDTMSVLSDVSDTTVCSHTRSVASLPPMSWADDVEQALRRKKARRASSVTQ